MTSRRRRGSTAVLLLVLVVALLVDAGPSVRSADHPSRATRMVRLVNTARIDHDVHRVRPKPYAHHLAHLHSLRMAAVGKLFHSTRYPWPTWGEVVGKGTAVHGLFKAFMHSAGHREIILSSAYRRIGVGFADTGPRLWVTMVLFRRG